MSKREERRHHLKRMKAKARRVAKNSWGYTLSYGYSPEELKQQFHAAEKWANHLKKCSCSMCGNPRRLGWYDGEGTRQEHLAYLKFLEETGRERQVKSCRYGKAGPNASNTCTDQGDTSKDGSRIE